MNLEFVFVDFAYLKLVLFFKYFWYIDKTLDFRMIF